MDVITPSIPLVDAFLACDRIAKPGGALTSIHSPVTDAKVSFGDTCAKMLANAFLSLHADGAIDLKVVEKKILFVKTHYVELRKKSAATTLADPCQELLNACVDGKSAKDAVYAFLRNDSNNPWSVVAKYASKQAIGLGLLRELKGGLTGMVGEKLTGIPKLETVPEKAAEIEARVAACAQRWSEFTSADAQLAEQLVSDCYNGIKSRTTQTDVSSNDW